MGLVPVDKHLRKRRPKPGLMINSNGLHVDGDINDDDDGYMMMVVIMKTTTRAPLLPEKVALDNAKLLQTVHQG